MVQHLKQNKISWTDVFCRANVGASCFLHSYREIILCFQLILKFLHLQIVHVQFAVNKTKHFLWTFTTNPRKPCIFSLQEWKAFIVAQPDKNLLLHFSELGLRSFLFFQKFVVLHLKSLFWGFQLRDGVVLSFQVSLHQSSLLNLLFHLQRQVLVLMKQQTKQDLVNHQQTRFQQTRVG